MKKGLYRLLTLLITIALVIGLLAGCGEKKGKETSDTPPKTEDKPADKNDDNNKDSTNQEENAGGKITDKPVTLTYWVGNRAFETDASMADTPLFKEMEKRTGVKIEFLHPPEGQGDEQFNLMIASNDLPDMIERNWLNYPGGPEKALEDAIIIDHTDAIEQYAPNLKKYLEGNPEVNKAVKTDSGKYYEFPFIRGDDFLMVWFGPQLRKDWLDELKLEVPETVDEWEAVLRAFKDQKGIEFPLSYRFANWKSQNNSFIIGAYGGSFDFYNDNEVVKYGRMEPGFKESLVTLQRWYKDGLLDPDFAAMDNKTFEAKITGEKAGAFIGSNGGNMGRFTTTVRSDNPDFMLTGAVWPTLNRGEKARFGHKDPAYRGDGVAITTQCKEVEVATKWLDYGYSEEGHMLYNFGIEGESYEIKDGYPTYTDLLMKNPDGLSVPVAMRRYIQGNSSGPFVQDRRYMEQYAEYPEQKEALVTWAKFDASTLMPPVTPTPEESQRLASIMNEINTYADEMFLKFVMGEASLDGFDAYVEQLKKMGIDEAIGIKQAALDRYNAR